MTWNSAREEKENWRKTFACQPFNEGNRSKSGQMHPHQCSRQTQSSTHAIKLQWYRFLHNFLYFLSLLYSPPLSFMGHHPKWMMLSRRIWESSHLPRENITVKSLFIAHTWIIAHPRIRAHGMDKKGHLAWFFGLKLVTKWSLFYHENKNW